MEITTVGLDIAKRVFQLHGGRCRRQGSIAAEAATIGSTGVLRRPTALFWLPLRLAARRIIERVRSGRWGMRCD
jgi:hypothetical protein